MAWRGLGGGWRRLSVAVLATVVCVASSRGDSGDALQLQGSLRLDKTQFEIGEPIPVTLELLNRGDAEYFVQTSTEDTGALDGCTFVVTDAAGRPVTAPPSPPRVGGWIGSWYSIRRHEKHERRLFLNHWFLALSPGRYVVSAQYVPHSFSDGRTVTWPAIRTSTVGFEIVPPTATKLDVRLSRLSEQAEKGDLVAVDFLGFTGDPAAAPPLVEALFADDPRLQRRAANALNYLYDPQTVLAGVVDTVKKRGPNVIAIEWLHTRGADAGAMTAICIGYAQADDASVRAGAVAGLRLWQEDVASKPKLREIVRATLLRAIDDRDPRVRIEAVPAMARTDDADALAALAKVAREDATGRVRSQAANCLNDLRSDAVVPHLREILLSDYRLRPNFAEQLRSIGSPAARSVLRDGVKCANPKVRLECAKQLWLMRDGVGRRALVETLRGGDADACADVAQFLRETAPSAGDFPGTTTEFSAQAWVDWLQKQR